MIWSRGEILPDDGLSVPVSDRTFEHGLGLFETLRTWQGRAPLLEAHRARMLRSAGALGLSIAPGDLPDDRAVTALLDAEGQGGDRLLRITATGGSDPGGSVVWMRSGPLPPPNPGRGASLLVGALEVAPGDLLARHKTLNYWSRRLASEEARHRGFDEATIGMSDEGKADLVVEGSRSNVFVVYEPWSLLGLFKRTRHTLATTSLDDPIVPGVMRGLVLEVARDEPINILEAREGIDVATLSGASEVFLTNSVRGIVPVGRAEHAGSQATWTWPVPGPVTRRLQELVAARLQIQPGEAP